MKPLTKAGITNFYLTSSYLTEKLESYLKQNYPKLNFTMLVEDEARGRAGAIRHAIDNNLLNPNDKYIILNCDDVIEIDIKELITHHETSKKNCTIVLAKSFTNPYGVVEFQENNVTNFTEKPQTTLPSGQGIHAGMGIFSNLKEFQNTKIPSHPEQNIYPNLAEKQEIGAYIVNNWQSVNTPDEYNSLKSKFYSTS